MLEVILLSEYVFQTKQELNLNVLIDYRNK